MAFYESPRFPENIALGAEGGPTFATDIAEMASGFESRNIGWALPLHRYTVTLLNRPQSELDELKAWFLVTKGMGHGFRFKDWSDYSATSTVGLLGTGVGTGATTYQMNKRYAALGVNIDRPIKKPVSGTVAIYKNAVAQTIVVGVPGAGQVSIDYTTGIVTFGTAPGGGDTLTWSGEFDVPARFDTDAMAAMITRGGASRLATWDAIPIRELRLA